MTDATLAEHGDQTPKKKRSGSNKRQRNWQYVVRCAKDEFNEIAANAREAGLRGAAYLRAKGLKRGDPGPRSQRIPPVQHEILLQHQGALGRLNNNANQIARNMNMGDFYDTPELRLMLKDYPVIRDHIFLALGKEPSPDMDTWDEFISTASQALDANPGAAAITIPAALLRRIIGGTTAQAALHPSERGQAAEGQPQKEPFRSNFLPPEGHA